MTTISEYRAAVGVAANDSERLSAMLELATALCRADPGESLSVALEAVDLAGRLDDEDRRARSLLQAARANYRLGNYRQALVQCREAGASFEARAHAGGMLAVANTLGMVHRYLGEFNKAAEQGQLALKMAQELGDASVIAGSWANLGVIHSLMGEYTLAMEQFRMAMTFPEVQSDQRLMVACRGGVGNVLLHRGDPAAALPHYHDALVISEQAGWRDDVATFRGNIGNVYILLGDYGTALSFYESALAMQEELGDRSGIARSTGSIGNVHLRLGDLPRALQYFRQAIEMFETLGDFASTTYWIGNLGGVYLGLAEHGQAMEEYRAACVLADAHGLGIMRAHASGGVGNVYVALGDYVQALEWYQTALSHAERANERGEIARWTGAIGRVHAARDFAGYDASRAEELLTTALDHAVGCGDRTLVQELHQWRSTLYQQEGRWEAAHRETTRYFEVKEELQNLEAHKKVQLFEHRRQLAELEKQRAVDQAQAEAAAEIHTMKAHQLERELSNATLQLLAQTELLTELRNDLLKIARKIPPGEPAARELRDRVKRLPCESVDWEKFDLQFREVHPDFVRALTERAPDLTATEVRICSMLRMNLKSHEIAQILCSTEKGVEFHRVNIRRKLKLRREEKLPIVLGAM